MQNYFFSNCFEYVGALNRICRRLVDICCQLVLAERVLDTALLHSALAQCTPPGDLKFLVCWCLAEREFFHRTKPIFDVPSPFVSREGPSAARDPEM